jgi:hypothetical protein
VRSCIVIVITLAVAGCSSSGGGTPGDGGREATARDATRDARLSDQSVDTAEATADVSNATLALVRLANWSPDAPGVDFCLAPHGSSLWSGPVLSGALGVAALGTVTVVDAGIPTDSGAQPHDAGAPDAGLDAGAHDTGLDAAADARADSAAEASAPPDAGLVDGPADASDDSHPAAGVPFPRISPYVSVSPGEYDVRVVAAQANDCATPLFNDTNDLPTLTAGAVVTLASVGDFNDQGADPPIGLVSFADDTSVPSQRVLLRFINAVPSVIETSLGTGRIKTGNFTSLVAAAQFGEVGADPFDGGVFAANDYLTLPPESGRSDGGIAVWSVVNANGGVTELLAVEGVSIPAGRLATAVTIGGESGPTETDIGLLLCVDQPPIVAGETATCTLLEGSVLTAPVCPGC